MSDFCSLCYCEDINYDTLIQDNFEQIKDYVDKEGYCFVTGGLCEGCGGVGITINKDLTVHIGVEYIGNLNPETYKVEVDEDSDEFKKSYKKKKEDSEIGLKVMIREFEAVRHIAYAMYMVGNDKLIVSLHDLIPFDEFNGKDHKELFEMAWDIYVKHNEYKDD